MPVVATFGLVGFIIADSSELENLPFELVILRIIVKGSGPCCSFGLMTKEEKNIKK